jgi:hypothetical protein
MRIVIAFAAAAVLATPVLAHKRDRGPAPENENNHVWLDYQTDMSEARRELKSDLRHATDEEDVRDAHEEYRQEIADARSDYVKHMRKRGYRVGTVTLDDDRYRAQ